MVFYVSGTSPASWAETLPWPPEGNTMMAYLKFIYRFALDLAALPLAFIGDASAQAQDTAF